MSFAIHSRCGVCVFSAKGGFVLQRIANSKATQRGLRRTRIEKQWFYNIQGGFELPTQMQLNGDSNAKVLKNQWILNLQGGFVLQLIANSNPTQRELKRTHIEKN